MMKATILLVVALAVSANGLGFPNFNLGCPFTNGPVTRFQWGNPTVANDGTTFANPSVIPYCRIVNSAFDDLSEAKIVARPGYTPVYAPVNSQVVIAPLDSFASLVGGNAQTAYMGVVQSIGAGAMSVLTGENSDITVGSTVGYQYSQCTTPSINFLQGVFANGLGLSWTIVCPITAIYGSFEWSNRGGNTPQGVAESRTLPRPYIFYGI